MPIRESSYGYWSSHATFLAVAGGAAIGIGNIARLPWLAGEYGGGLFLAVYFAALALMSWPLLAAEWVLGRWTRQDLVSGLLQLTEAAHVGRPWVAIGALSLASAVLVLSYYSVIAGWSLAYVFRSAAGVLQGLSDAGTHRVFLGVARDPERSLAWHTLFMVTACIIVAHGVRDGIERAARYLAPAALLLVVALAVYAYRAGDGAAALRHMLLPDTSHFGWHSVMEAIHQAFFTMALGVGAMYAYGGYLPAQAPLLRLAAAVIAIDTLFSLVAGFALYALVLGAHLDPAPGITLLFQVFPLALPDDGSGVVAATGLYLVLVMITLLAACALMEPIVRSIAERLRLTRVFAATACAMLVWFLGLGTLLSFNVFQQASVLGTTFFDWVQWLTGKLLMPLTGLLLTILVSRVLPAAMQAELWGEGPRRARDAWIWLLRFPARVAMLLLLLYCVGLIDFLVELWS
ncbi:MAG TPA: sodium-dependent transporter [Candidatus Binatia bacterium]|nr:sodium-dependent transporter [Candidatus Binatia bacterium]